MDRDRPAPILCLLRREAHILEIVLIEELGSAVRTRRPGQRGDGIDDKLEVALALAERLLGALLIVDVDVQCVPAHNAPIGVAKGQPANVKPTILSICAEKSVYRIVRNPGRSRM